MLEEIRRNDWRVVDFKLRAIARRRMQDDAEELKWLREAERLRIWTRFGEPSMLAYVEQVLEGSPSWARGRTDRTWALAITLSGQSKLSELSATPRLCYRGSPGDPSSSVLQASRPNRLRGRASLKRVTGSGSLKELIHEALRRVAAPKV